MYLLKGIYPEQFEIIQVFFLIFQLSHSKQFLFLYEKVKMT